jgi:hypothetical protein
LSLRGAERRSNLRVAIGLLYLEKRVSYRRLQKEFGLHDETLEDVCHQLIVIRLAVDEGGQGLAFAGTALFQTPATQGMFTGWVNAAGLSGICVPGKPHPDGRPIGVQIVAPFGHDAVVLEIAQRLENFTPWTDRWPALALTV